MQAPSFQQCASSLSSTTTGGFAWPVVIGLLLGRVAVYFFARKGVISIIKL